MLSASVKKKAFVRFAGLFAGACSGALETTAKSLVRAAERSF
jgi:hypothetical protein